jgi:predicted RNase H-like HicB family nuclease
MNVGGHPMDRKFTAIYIETPEGYIGFVEELPGANTQGETLEEVRENLSEAIALILETNRELIENTVEGKRVQRETISVEDS